MRKTFIILLMLGLAGCTSQAEVEAEVPAVESPQEDSGSQVESDGQAGQSEETSTGEAAETSVTDIAEENADSIPGDFDIEAALENVSNLLESAQDSGIAECTGNTFPAEAMDVGFGTEAFTSCQTDFGSLVINEYPSDSHAVAASDSYIDVVAGLDYSERINLAVMNDERTYIYVWGEALAQLDVPALANHLGFDYEQILTGLLE